ncbi:MAG: PD40 domain-containing protein [Anaerolineae bacterium]|nr:PD40 domain-containing protein [Anaerolineae bacterium]
MSAAAEDIQIDTAMCEISGLHDSPNGRWIAVDVNCEAGSHTLLLEASTGQIQLAEPEPWSDSFFLNWAPDGDSFLLRVDPIGDDVILLVNARNGRFEQMDTPSFTYDVAFSPDGKRVLYAVSRGLGFGSEVWLMDRNGRNREQIISDPAHVIAYPRWSPTGDAIAYIRMADSNVPFTVGELALADGNGRGERVVALADAGHGYQPVWSPDGRQVAFVVRENAGESAADVAAFYLESNVYLADAASGGVRAVTRFEGALTDGPAWSPNGAWMAFSTDVGGVADVWLVEVASGEMQQVTQNASAFCPVWIAGGKR